MCRHGSRSTAGTAHPSHLHFLIRLCMQLASTNQKWLLTIQSACLKEQTVYVTKRHMQGSFEILPSSLTATGAWLSHRDLGNTWLPKHPLFAQSTGGHFRTHLTTAKVQTPGSFGPWSPGWGRGRLILSRQSCNWCYSCGQLDHKTPWVQRSGQIICSPGLRSTQPWQSCMAPQELRTPSPSHWYGHWALM